MIKEHDKQNCNDTYYRSSMNFKCYSRKNKKISFFASEVEAGERKQGSYKRKNDKGISELSNDNAFADVFNSLHSD